jgi:hypothetical protein
MLASNPASILNQNSPKKKILTDSVNHGNDLELQQRTCILQVDDNSDAND